MTKFVSYSTTIEMIREAEIDKAIKSLFDEIQFTQEPHGLYDPLRYMIEIGGKRLRPKLCLTTYSLYKDSIGSEILSPAAALEVFHSFTLIHDDIMDRSPLRRRMPTVWTKWSEDTAILSGDVMCIDSYARIAKAPSDVLMPVMELFSKTAAQVCEGQQYDMEFESKDAVPMNEYIKMIGLKTSVLIACAAKMGALIAGASSEDCENLYEYGYYLGLAFQVEDDYLDAYGDEKVFGKPIGGDIVNSKKSWLTVRAMEKADESLKRRIIDTMAAHAATASEKTAKIDTMMEIYSSLGIAEDAKAEIVSLTDKALSYAREVCKGVRYETLRRFAESLVGRKS
jgi:geranylgeranyl diphosphate synthase type II